MGAAASRYYQPSPTRVIQEAFSDTRSSVFAYTGWHGVGMSMGAKAVAELAMESNLFDPVVLVTAGESCSSLCKLQRKVAEQLKIRNNDDDDYDDDDNAEEVARRIFNSLGGRNFLLIIDNLLLQMQGIDDGLGLIGVPTTPSQWSRSKILITTPYFQVIRAMNNPRTFLLSSFLEDRSIVPSDVGSTVDKIELGGVDELLGHFHDEADNIANILGIRDQVEQVFSCCIYLSLFQQTPSTSMDAKEILKYYVGEGFLTTTQQQLDGLDGLEGAFRHGEAVLAQLVGGCMAEETSSAVVADVDGKKNSLNSHLWTILHGQQGRRYLKEKLHIQLEAAAAANCMLEGDAASARWVSLSHNKIQATDHLPPLFIPTTRCANQLSTLLLNDNPRFKQIPDTFFHQMPNLRVLDLSRTSISSFPTSFSSLVHLTFLKLQECPCLEALPPSLKHLKQLIILDLRGTPLISIPSEALEQKTNLRFIDLSYTNINHSHQPPSFSALRNLEQLWLAGCGSVMSSSEDLKSTLSMLDLSYSPDLRSLPTSLLMNFTSLKKLLLKECNSFEGLPGLVSSQLRLLSALEELDMSGCGALKDVENVSLEDLPKLRALNLSHTKIARLSITRCASLEMVWLRGLTNLKSLHLSSIKIKEFPHEISELTRLEELHLTDVKQLRRVEWKKVQWLPEKLEWDECGCCSSSKPPAANNLLLLQLEEVLGGENREGGAFISVSNGNIFKHLSLSSPLWEQSFSKFNFYICPCLKQEEKKEKQTRVGVGRKQQVIVLPYASIYSKMKHHHYVGRRRDFCRRLKIEGGVSLSRGDGDGRRRLVETVVRRAEVLWLRENGFVKSLSDLINVEEMEGLEECWVERCHNIHILFPATSDGKYFRNVSVGPSSQRLWVSELGSLGSVYDGRNEFRFLKHLHIQCCPKLETLFSSDPCLFQLKTLHIRFCARLESLFKESSPSMINAFPKLYSLYLWELPKLKHICHGSLPSLECLRVRGCPHLQQLPGLDPRKVKKVEGEYEWWSNLKRENQREIMEGGRSYYTTFWYNKVANESEIIFL